MSIMIHPEQGCTTNKLLAQILIHAKAGEHVQFLVQPGSGASVVQRLRVALSRSRNRHRRKGGKVEEFTLRHTVYAYTMLDGSRRDCVVVWIEREAHHVVREMLDDLLER